MDHKAVIMIVPHIGKRDANGHFFLSNLDFDHCKELDMSPMIEFQKNTKSFSEAMGVIKEKMNKIQEILDE